MTESPLQIADDIYQVQLPLPFALRIVNCYLLRGSHGWTVVDTGLNRPEAQGVWLAAFEALGIIPQTIQQIVLTHVHPDHYGMAGWLQRWCQAGGGLPPVFASTREARAAEILWWPDDGRAPIISAFMRDCGVPDELISAIVEGIVSTRAMTLPHPPLVKTLEPGQMLRMGERDFRMIHAPGHSDGQLLFYDSADRLLLSGDHVLMRITPNIGLWPDTEPEPLRRFLESLRELRWLDVRLALPGHKALITDWQTRIDQLLAHHDERLSHVYDAVADRSTVYAVSRQIFDFERLSNHERRFAIVETLAHLEFLVRVGELEEQAEGVKHYWRA